jgi:hypothetical protein
VAALLTAAALAASSAWGASPGSLDTGFSDDGYTMAVQRDGNVVLAGDSTPSLANGFDFSLARFRNGPGHPAARSPQGVPTPSPPRRSLRGPSTPAA